MRNGKKKEGIVDYLIKPVEKMTSSPRIGRKLDEKNFRPYLFLILSIIILLSSQPKASFSQTDQAELKNRVLQTLYGFLDQFSNCTFGGVVSLGNKSVFRERLSRNLNIELAPNLDKRGQYQPGGVSLGYQVTNNVLRIQSFQDGSPIPFLTLWHEYIHHLINVKGGEPCGPEEAYLELCESRIHWLRNLVSFDNFYKEEIEKREPNATKIKERWGNLDGQWQNFNKWGAPIQNLSGPFTWEDSYGQTCKTDATTRYTIDSDYIKKLDQEIGIIIDIEKIRPLYTNTFSGSPGATVRELKWELTEKIPDPDKMTGKAIGGYNVVQSMNESGTIITNELLKGTKRQVQASANMPSILQPRDTFTVTLASSCQTESDYCCMEAGVYAENIDCQPQKRVGGCGKTINQTQAYTCTAPQSDYDNLEVVPFAGGVGPLVKYIYKKKISDKEPSVTTTPPSSILSYLPVPTLEDNTDRPGMDYTSFELSEDEPQRCLHACAMDTNCKAYTYVRPGKQGPKARCWLKSGIPEPSKNNCCVSGTKIKAHDHL